MEPSTRDPVIEYDHHPTTLPPPPLDDATLRLLDADAQRWAEEHTRSCARAAVTSGGGARCACGEKYRGQLPRA